MEKKNRVDKHLYCRVLAEVHLKQNELQPKLFLVIDTWSDDPDHCYMHLGYLKSPDLE